MEDTVKVHFIDTDIVNPSVFGLDDVTAVKCKKHDGKGDVRRFSLRGWETFADCVEYHPVTGEYLGHSEWWIYAAKGKKYGR